ncbi:uncharacterized protein FIBRA_03347 [Fibroporia radiculosa]|uniref:Uncharacterized protein n=1 Tax=Fibroporia radiculosa TaxID=599839 RepID=J4G552_9APHY|nr:uncharacterized protein FIBRA_03347 [Fibroporia radiculosa]CCM01298.1 predicted protein [Fibroporia radiculosa]
MSIFRTAITPAIRSSAFAASSRALHVSPVAAKSATENVKEVAHKVNISVGRGLASALEKGEEVTGATKETLAPKVDKAKKATSQASEKANEASQSLR